MTNTSPQLRAKFSNFAWQSIKSTFRFYANTKRALRNSRF
ncbi:hypothetical protein HFN_1469 [Helicobacter fennelliae MRY12-0050]|uniref:Uncharacterized protein n=1 Tax=Helicobacter fennelliae MRY12-0050 TaxID=1325130 RepID=T1CVV4_9HELI|nr:hypothetical protein HFN_1469 [Helicobacter fennelliae MRY12-0050]